MVLIGREHLPASLLLVVVTPDPVAAAKLGREQPRLLVQVDDLLAFGRRIANQVPDGLGRFVARGAVDEIVVDVVNRLAAIHPAVTIRFRFTGALTAAGNSGNARGPLAGELKDRQTRPIAEPYVGPLSSAARLLPDDARRTVRDAAEKLDFARHRFTEAVGFLNHFDLHCRHAGDDRFAHHVRRQVVFQHYELAAVALRGNAPTQDDFVLEWIEMRRRIMDRLPDPQHAHSRLKLSRFILDLDDDGRLIEQLTVEMLA